jgi:hypothetical protein|tara:strand:- start:1017 stop:1655 length:639 start_codon:yes stop_codon:yes gene_type:complete
MALELESATFDPTDKPKRVEEGTYPAHIASLATKDINTRAGQAIVVNMTYKVADEVADQTQPMWEMDGFKYVLDEDKNKIPVMNGSGKQMEESCDHLLGRTFYDNGWFVFTTSQSSSKNERYFSLLDRLGVKCKEQQIEGKKVKKLVLLEDDDVIGKPVLVDVKRQSYITKETRDLPPAEQERRTIFRVTNLNVWHEGKAISADELLEDVPF